MSEAQMRRIHFLRSIVKAREAEIEQLRAALHYYADSHENPNDGPWGMQSDDFGSVARAALEGSDG